jgi:hypothetical protein
MGLCGLYYDDYVFEQVKGVGWRTSRAGTSGGLGARVHSRVTRLSAPMLHRPRFI